MMKKFLLSLALLTFAGYMSAQTLLFEHEGETIEAGSHYVIGDLNENKELQFEVQVINNSTEIIDVTCERVEIITSGINYFCWGQCLSPNLSINTLEGIEPGVSNLFSGHFMPMDQNSGEFIPGLELQVEYHFTIEGSEEEYVFDIYYKYSLESIADYNDVKVFSNAYPNPANNTVSFNYNLPYDVQSASVSIYNMMGQEVINQNLNIGGSRVDFNVSDLTEGVYFYSLIINNQTVKTNKFVVSR